MLLHTSQIDCNKSFSWSFFFPSHFHRRDSRCSSCCHSMSLRSHAKSFFFPPTSENFSQHSRGTFINDLIDATIKTLWSKIEREDRWSCRTTKFVLFLGRLGFYVFLVMKTCRWTCVRCAASYLLFAVFRDVGRGSRRRCGCLGEFN